MRLVLKVAVFLIATAAPSHAQEQLKVGNSYSGNVKLSSSNSGIYLALPQGNWFLASLEETRDRNLNAPMISGSLVSTDAQKRVVGVVLFTAGNDATGGWEPSAYCSRKDLFFLHAEVQRRGRGMHCWGLSAINVGAPTATAANYIRDFYQWIAKNGYRLPQSVIVTEIVRSSGAKLLRGSYFRNPEIDGFSRSAASVWQKDVVVGNQKRLKYLENTKAWGEQWQPTFEAAFAGRPK